MSKIASTDSVKQAPTTGKRAYLRLAAGRKVAPSDRLMLEHAAAQVFDHIIAWPEHADATLARLEQEEFAQQGARRLFATMIDMRSRGAVIDPYTLGEYLKARNASDEELHMLDLALGASRYSDVAVEPYIVQIKDAARNDAYLAAIQTATKRITEDNWTATAATAEFEQTLKTLKNASPADEAENRGFYDSFVALSNDPTPVVVDEVIKGLPRGQVAELVAPTDGGKSTITLNASLSLAAGLAFLPLVPSSGTPRRVLYLDFESTAGELRRDVTQMLRRFAPEDAAIAITNFFPVVDATIDDEPLSLSNPDHLRFVIEWARRIKADLIVVDTVSAAFEIVNENDNAEVRNRVMRPLRNFAVLINAGIFFLHHDSKAIEIEGQEGAYRGRGASSFGTLSRAVFTLTKELTLGDGFVTLKQRKGKGGKLQPHLLEIDLVNRWVSISDKEVMHTVTNYELVLEAAASKDVMTTTEIKQALEGKVSKRSVDASLKSAVDRGDLVRSKYGQYSKPRLVAKE